MLNIFTIISLFTASISGLASSEKSPRGRIVGGYEVTPNSKYPWIVSLALMGSHQCGGMAYKPTVVLTAAHCTIFDDEDWTVRFRYYDFSKSPKFEFDVVERKAHPHYDRNKFDLNDIAIWKTNKPFDLSPNEYITIDQDRLSETEGYLLKVAGWGGLKQGGDINQKLMEVEIPTFDIKTCKRAMASENKVVDQTAMFCAGFPEGGKDACQGDSGGPAFTFKNKLPVLVGIVSWGYGCAIPGFPAIFTKLEPFSNFINTSI